MTEHCHLTNVVGTDSDRLGDCPFLAKLISVYKKFFNVTDIAKIIIS
jgi:hypothetical protein